MLRAISVCTAFVLLSPWCVPPLRAAGDTHDRPNVILILADDLGWADLGCYGNTFNQTPSIDRLAGEGMRFTQFYAGPVCSPTRANLQSGQDQARFGITQHIPGHRRPFARLIDPVVPTELPLQVETFAERLQSVGYRTGYLGKWHLGKAGFGPAQQGWQTVVECQGHTVPPDFAGDPPWRTAEYLTERAIEFISAESNQPFLLQVSHSAVHIPLMTTPERLSKYQHQPRPADYPAHAAYAGLLEELDESVGRIVAAVDRLGLTERTLIVFLSDNGGLEHEQSGRVVTSNRPLRGEKGTLYEGGIRIPAIARWPARIPPGSLCATPVITMDLYPTLLELSGAAATPGQDLDGVSLVGLWQDDPRPLDREALYWHLPHYHHSTPASAIRLGDWKLIEFFETGQRQLFDLAHDLGETDDRAEAEPQRVAALHAELVAWRERVGARLPIPNPGHDPARAGELSGGRKSVNRTR